MTLIGTIKEIWRYPVKSMAGERIESSVVGQKGVPGDRGWALRDELAKEIRGAKKMPQLMLCEATYAEQPTESFIPQVTMRLADGATVKSTDPDVGARLSAFLGRTVTLWSRQPESNTEHYRRGAPDNSDMQTELREIFGRLPGEPIPDLSPFPEEIFKFTSPLGTYFDAFPLHLLTTASLEALAHQNSTAQWDARRFRPNFVIATETGQHGLVEADWGGRSLRIGGLTIQCNLPTPRCVMTTQAVPGLAKDPSILRTIVRDAAQNLGIYAIVQTPGRVAVGDPVELI